MLASFETADLQISPVRPGEVIRLVADASYNAGSSDAWFVAAWIMAAGAAFAMFNADKQTTAFMVGAAFGSMWNAYDAARSS